MPEGVYTLQDLRRLDYTTAQVREALNSGALVRIARGWFASAEAARPVIAAVKAGGRLGCLSGCKLYGLWTPTHLDDHIIVGRGAKVRNSSWHRHRAKLPKEAMFSVEDCLRQVVRHHDAESALMVLESAVNLKKVTHTVAQEIAASGSVKKQRLLSHVDRGAGSGSETRVRLFIQQHRFSVRSQVTIEDVGRVDMLVGKSLIIECDSKAHHTDPTEDRRRDLAAIRQGYFVLRLSFGQVHDDWPNTRLVLLKLLRLGRHRLAPVPL